MDSNTIIIGRQAGDRTLGEILRIEKEDKFIEVTPEGETLYFGRKIP